MILLLRRKNSLMITHLHIDKDSYCEQIREPESDIWDRGDSSTSYTLNSVVICDPSKSYDLMYDGNLTIGERLYVVYAIYSTGDSFGIDEDGCIDFISVHKDSKIAEANVKLLTTCKEGIKIMLDGGYPMRYYPPWLGYFESLSYVRIFESIIGSEIV